MLELLLSKGADISPIHIIYLNMIIYYFKLGEYKINKGNYITKIKRHFHIATLNKRDVRNININFHFFLSV